MAHTHSVIDDDLRFIIDPSTREIGNGSQKVKLMQYDHNSEQFTFEIPRFVEGHDMSLCNSIRVNYININKSNREQHPGVYEVSDIKVEEDNIIFSWLVSRNATQYVGPLNFLIKFMCFDENGYITYEWHTDIFKSASVSTGMNNEESIEEVYPDILEKWKNDVLAEEASRITAESERVAAESERVAAESERVSAESERATAESERVAAESGRATAESGRATAESERVAAESERATAESGRVAAESERANTFSRYETEINQFKNEIVTGKDSATDNTKFAIGEAEQNLEVPTMEEFNKLADSLPGKLTEPAEGLAVGKYFRVAAIDENGHAVLEAVEAKDVGVQDVQMNGVSTVTDSIANVKFQSNGGLLFDNTYGLRLQQAGLLNIDARSNKQMPVTSHNLDYAVKAAMCDGKGAAWTADEQAAARERMGIPGDYELIADVTSVEDVDQFFIDKDNDGADFKLVKAIIFSETPKYVGSLNTLFLRTYIYAVNNLGQKKNLLTDNIFFSKRYDTYARTDIDFTGGIPSAIQYPLRSSKIGGTTSSDNFGYNYDQEGTLLYIYKIGHERYDSNSPIIPAGTRIKLYGVRA